MSIGVRLSTFDAVKGQARWSLPTCTSSKIVEDISARAWDARQYVIEYPNGYHIKIAEPISEEE
jgi:hypothetical protein